MWVWQDLKSGLPNTLEGSLIKVTLAQSQGGGANKMGCGLASKSHRKDGGGGGCVGRNGDEKTHRRPIGVEAG